MDKREYDRFVFRVKKYLTSKRLQLDPSDITHKIIEMFGFTETPPYLSRRIIDVLRKEYGHGFQRFDLHNNGRELQQVDTIQHRNTIREFEVRYDLHKLFKHLTGKQRQLLRLHLKGYSDHDIGLEYGVTDSRVAQMINEALIKLKIALNLPPTKVRRAHNPRSIVGIKFAHGKGRGGKWIKKPKL